MNIPSDISRSTEKFTMCFFYIVGTISLVVNSATLAIVIRKSQLLTREVKFLTIFQQLSCLLSNAFLTLCLIPFFYLRMGGGYCMGVLCHFVPYEYLLVVEMFLNVCMLSSFGMMIIARQQMLLWDDSVLKMHTFVRYAVYALVNIVLHLWTAVTVLAIPSDRRRQIESLAGFYQLTWRERGLNWFLYQGLDKQILTRLTYYGFIIQVPAFFIFILLPFSHMLYMVIQARNKMQSQKNRVVHIKNANTIIVQASIFFKNRIIVIFNMQFVVILIFIIIPFVPAAITSTQWDIYRDSQTAVAIAECVFVCSTLANSIVIVSRNRVYLKSLSRFVPSHSASRQIRHSIQSVSSVIRM